MSTRLRFRPARQLLSIATMIALLAGCTGTHGVGNGTGDTGAGADCRPGDGERHAGHRMVDSRFSDKTLRCAVFDGTELHNPDFSGTDLSKASFRDASLSDADFSGAVLVEADFTGARLTTPAFADADLRGADLRGVAMAQPDWAGATCPDGVPATENGCDGHLDPTPVDPADNG